MPYNWAQLGFVEKWRRHAVHGQIIGMYRPEDKTFFDLRIRPGDPGVGQLPGAVELHLLDAGDMIREKRLALMQRVPVVVLVPATPAAQAAPSQARAPGAHGRPGRWLESGAGLSGKILQVEDDLALLDVGFHVVVQLPESGSGAGLRAGQPAEFTVSATPKGFLVV